MKIISKVILGSLILILTSCNVIRVNSDFNNKTNFNEYKTYAFSKKGVDQAEINDIHIGRNITDYAWDGTDTYGDPVGNGVYLYRVVAKINGENIELNQVPGQEQYFNSGIGKMTIIR